ncbi:chitobiase/beta-hexosaminidase C-terminal domain-containing protein [Paenibacillus sp. FSL H7-0357]
MKRGLSYFSVGTMLLGVLTLFLFHPQAVNAANPAPDSFTLKSYDNLPSSAMSDLAYGNNTYIAVGYYGAIIKSADAETWVNVKTKADITYTGVADPSSFTFNGVAYGNGLFVVGGSAGVILTSPDGTTWTQRTSNVSKGIGNVEFLQFNGNSAFYATTEGKYLTSADGITWTSVVPTGLASSDYVTRITVGNNGSRLAIGAGNGKIYSTTNGTTWTVAQPSGPSGPSIGTNMITWMKDRYYISDPLAYIWTSTDLSTFTLLGSPFKQNSSQYNNQMFNGFYDGTKYYLFGYEAPNYGAVYTSTNGTTWTMQPFKNYFVTQSSMFVNGKYFRLGNEGMMVSPNGSDWSYKWGGAFYEVIHDGSQYVAVGKEGGDGAIWTSGDLTSWSKAALPSRTGTFTAAAYGNNKYVAIGDVSQTTAALATSTDGSAWTVRSSINDSTSLTDIAFGNGKFVAVGAGSGSVPKIKTSVDGVVWNEPVLPVQSIDALYTVTYDNNQFIALGYGYDSSGNVDQASIWTSTDGDTWVNHSSAYPNHTEAFNNIVYDGSKYVLTGYNSTTYEVFSRTSVDLSAWSAPTLTGTYSFYGASTMMGQKGNNIYMVAIDSNNVPGIYYTGDQGSTWQDAGVDLSDIDINAIYALMELNGGIVISGNSQLVMSATGSLAQVDAPTANPTGAGGAVASGTAVTLSSATSGAVIYYTTDGTTPTSSSTLYSGAITLTSAKTIKAIAVKPGMTDSAVLSESYTIMAQVDAPTASPAGGEVASGTAVTLSSATSGAVIYYTTDGTTPTISSTLYSGAITLTSAKTIKAIAVKPGMTDSSVLSESYTIMAQVDAPTASPAGGEVASGTAVTLSSATSGAVIYYTTDGTTPTSSSTLYSGAITLTSATTIKAIAVKPGMTDSSVLSESYTIMAQVDAPTASPARGEVASGTAVTLSSATSGAVIYYTTDGTTPTISSTLYSGAITLTSAKTIKAIAVKPGMTDSTVLSESYTIMAQVDAPTANPAGGEVASGTAVTLSSATSGAVIYYTADGTTPTSSSTLYSGAITLTSAKTIKAIAVKPGMTDSSVLSEGYTIMAQVDAPTASPAGGEVASGTAVTLSSATSGAVIYYTTDGTTPTISSTLYSGAITLTSAKTIKAIAVKPGMTDSAVLSESYTIMAQVDAPTASPAGGEVASGTAVTLSSATSGAVIYYTTDGTTPTSSSTLYSGAITLTSAKTIKAIAVKPGMTDSSVLSESYTIMAQVAAPTANPAGGEVASGTAVTLSSATSGAVIYYTTDGTTPTSSSTLYSGAITLTSAKTIKAIAVKPGMTDSTVLSESYTIMAQVDAPTASPAGGAVASGTEVTLSSATSGALIYYTTDGTTPTSSSTLYSGAITLTSAKTIKAIAVKPGMTDSSVLSESYTIMAQVAAPTANPAGGEVASGTAVTLSSATSGALIYYTTDGTTPTISSTLYNGAITLTSAKTIKAIAVKPGMTDSTVLSESYTIMVQVDAPTASPAGGEVASGTAVTLSSATSGAVIYYTTDGTTPTISSTLYNGAITLTSAKTIKAIAVKPGMTDSAVLSESYTITAQQVAAPTANPAGGEVASGTAVTLSSATSGAVIYYTTDGTTPTSSSTLYSGAITLTSAKTIKAIAVKPGMTDSSVLSESYTITAQQVAAPTANPAGGEVASGTEVTLSSATSGALIYYTTDGTTPSSSSTLYNGPITLTSAKTIKAIAVKPGMTDSTVLSESYTITAQQVAAPTANPAGGEVASGTAVTLSSATSGAVIYYTTDGTTPTSSSTLYSGAITLTSAKTIKAIAVKPGMTDSSVLSESYTITAQQVAAPTANPAGGEVASGTEVTLSSATSGALIYYTTDGTTPSSSSTLYNGPITLTSAKTIKAIAVKPGMTDSTVLSESYTISTANNSSISPKTASFDKNTGKQADVVITMMLNGNNLTSISNGVAYLAAGSDYTVSGNTVTLQKDYLATLAEGTTSLTFNFTAGAVQTLVITVTDTSVPIPGVPFLQSAFAGNGEINLIWSPVTGSIGYKIFQRLSSSEYGNEIATVSGSVYSYKAAGLNNGTAYYFVVKAANEVGDSAASNELNATPKTVPGAPTDITAVAGNGQAVVSFTAPAETGGSTITGYEVTASPGNIVGVGTTGPITITGLTNGTAYTFTVKAINGAGSSASSALSNEVTPIAPSVPSGGGGNETPPVITTPVTNDGVDVFVNGKVERAGTATTSIVNGQSVTTVIIDQKKLEERLAAEGQGALITIPVISSSNIVIGELSGQMIKSMEQKQAVLEFKSGNATYTLPAAQINIESISTQLGASVALEDIKIQIEIAKPTADTLRIVENSAAAGEFTLAAPPLNFVIRAQYGDTTVEITKFNAYVERMIALPDGVDPNRITTGVVVEPDGSVRHVPTKVAKIDQQYFAIVNSLTNSTYSIIWHPLEFKDMDGHWAKDIVNNMGSRMIIDGVGNGAFNPAAEITRAEFAAIVVRGLGLKLENGTGAFSDVKASDWYSSSVQTAYAYKLINGFEDGNFRPLDKITREQAMTMIAKAMEITALKDKLQNKEASELLSSFTDAGSVSKWAVSSAADSVAAGIVSGRTSTRLDPQASITRAEVAAMIQRLLQRSDLI